jgi:hypothetical protein
MINEQEAEQLKKEMGGKICTRCFLSGKDLEGIPKDKDEYISDLMNVMGNLWCTQHYLELSGDLIGYAYPLFYGKKGEKENE